MLHAVVSRKSTVAFLFGLILLVRTAPAVVAYMVTGSAVFYTAEYDPLLYLGGARSMLATCVNEFPFFAPLNFSFIAGLLSLGNDNELVPVLATACLGWLSVVVLYCMARDLFNSQAAFWAAFFFGFYPNLVFYGMNLYPETLAIFFIICSFALLVRYFKTSQLLYVVCSGILWGLASQTRGGVHFFSAGMCCAVMLHVRVRGWAAFVKPVFALLLSVYATIYILGMLFAPFNQGMVLNSQSGMGSVLHGANRVINCNADYGLARESLFYSINVVGEAWPDGAQVYSDALMQQDAMTIMKAFWDFVMQDPLSYTKSGFERLSFLWSPNQLLIKYIKLNFYYRLPLLTEAVCLVAVAVFVLALCLGLLGFILARDPFRGLFALFFVFYCLLIFFTVGNAKLRLPLLPFIMMYAGYFCSLIIARSAVFRKKAAVCAGLLSGLIILNSVYRYKDIAISPGEFNVRQVETSFSLGFPKTSLFLLEKNMIFQHYTEQQLLRLNTVRQKLNERDHQ